MKFDDVINYFGTFSGYHNHASDVTNGLKKDRGLSDEEARKTYESDHDILRQCEMELKKIWSLGGSEGNTEFRVRWKVPVVMVGMK